MGFTFPRDQLDDPAVYREFVGGFWARFFNSPGNIDGLIRNYRIAERQLYAQQEELQATVGRQACPPLHTQDWYALSLRQSAEVGVQVGADGTYAYGVPSSSLVAYPLPAEVRQCQYVATAVTRPSATWHRGVTMDLDLVAGKIVLDRSPFADPTAPLTPILDAAGNVTDRSLTLWLFKALLDWQYLWQQFGYVLGVGQGLVGSQAYKDLLNALYDAATAGSSYAAVAAVVEAVSGIPRVKVDGEVVQAVTQDASHVLVITDRAVYRFVPGVTPVVAEGQVLRRDDQLIDAVQVVEPTGGQVPAFLKQLALGRELLLPTLSGELVFPNSSGPLNVQTGVSGRTKLTWPVGGFQADVDAFFTALHNRGVTAGATLANYLDTRPVVSRVGEPDATALPSTFNPLAFLFQNVLRNNCLVAYLRAGQFGPDALGTSLLGVLRKLLPPHTTLLVLVELTQSPETVSMDADGGSSATGYAEAYSVYSAAG